jgi:hypothetical protein
MTLRLIQPRKLAAREKRTLLPSRSWFKRIFAGTTAGSNLLLPDVYLAPHVRLSFRRRNVLLRNVPVALNLFVLKDVVAVLSFSPLRKRRSSAPFNSAMDRLNSLLIAMSCCPLLVINNNDIKVAVSATHSTNVTTGKWRSILPNMKWLASREIIFGTSSG